MQSGVHHHSSIRGKLKSSICCLRGTVHHDQLDHNGELCYNKLRIIPTTPRSQNTPTSSPGISSWLKKSSPTNSEYGGDMPRVRGRSLRSRMSRALHHHHHHHHHRQSQSADFSYDPSSYALNFENESPDEEHPLRNFTSRLPASPPSSSTTALKCSDDLAVSGVPKEIVGYS